MLCEARRTPTHGARGAARPSRTTNGTETLSTRELLGGLPGELGVSSTTHTRPRLAEGAATNGEHPKPTDRS